jgi:membrane-associated phospholipid phosphatase
VKDIIKQNRIFLIPYFTFLIVGCALLIVFDNKAALHITINKYHNSFFDLFFYYATFLGDGVTAILLSIILLAVKFRQFFIVAVSNIVSASITQLLKHTVFSDVYRPKKFFEGIYDLYFVPGVENYLYNSFPSGHSTCAFTLYCSFALIAKKNTYKFLFFILALTAGFSRIYLSQHFLQDVLAGSFIGVTIAFAFYLLFKNSNKPIMELNIISLFKKA